MKLLLLSLVSLLGLAQAQETYQLTLLLNGQPVHWDPGEGVTRNGDLFQVNDTSVPLTVYFEGGRLELDLEDFGTFDRAHVLGVRYRRTGENTYSMGATVRHADTQEDYASVIRFEGEGVENGTRDLLHPHVNEQPFTRSKDGVVARGEVRVTADDTVGEGGGSAIVLDFGSEPFSSLERANLRVELERR